MICAAHDHHHHLYCSIRVDITVVYLCTSFCLFLMRNIHYFYMCKCRTVLCALVFIYRKLYIWPSDWMKIKDFHSGLLTRQIKEEKSHDDPRDGLFISLVSHNWHLLLRTYQTHPLIQHSNLHVGKFTENITE